MSQKTVLLVDDDPVSLSLLSKLILKQSFDCVLAEDGAHAKAILRERAVSVIVADYDMPNMNGLELLKLVKTEFPLTPFILVTAFSNLQVLREAWAEGAFDFFQKPVFVDRLNQTIRLAAEYGHLSIARRSFTSEVESPSDPGLIEIGVVRELTAAIDRADLLTIVEEYEVLARIELEQIFRFGVAGQSGQVHLLAHRLAGTSLNLGLSLFAKELRKIEEASTKAIDKPAELEIILEQSIYWLKNNLISIFKEESVPA